MWRMCNVMRSLPFISLYGELCRACSVHSTEHFQWLFHVRNEVSMKSTLTRDYKCLGLVLEAWSVTPCPNPAQCDKATRNKSCLCPNQPYKATFCLMLGFYFLCHSQCDSDAWVMTQLQLIRTYLIFHIQLHCRSRFESVGFFFF